MEEEQQQEEEQEQQEEEVEYSPQCISEEIIADKYRLLNVVGLDDICDNVHSDGP